MIRQLEAEAKMLIVNDLLCITLNVIVVVETARSSNSSRLFWSQIKLDTRYLDKIRVSDDCLLQVLTWAAILKVGT